MSRSLFILAVPLLAACSAELASGPESELSSPVVAASVDAGVGARASGSAHFLTGGEQRTVTFTAATHADGSVSGNAEINIHALDAWWHTRIECVTVVGNRAYLGGTITAASDARIVVGAKSYFWVEDQGEGADAPPDRVSLAGFNETPGGLADFCGLVQNLLPGRDVVRGNVQVQAG